MKFHWNQPIPDEVSAGEPLSPWFYAALFLIIECAALFITASQWPKDASVMSGKFLCYVLVNPLLVWGATSIAIYKAAFGNRAQDAAIVNAQRWHLLTDWQRQGRSGTAVLGSVVLTAEPDLAERMLALDGTPPDNPGRVMSLDSLPPANGQSRRRAMLEKLLAPLTASLAHVARSGSFEVLIQCAEEDVVEEVREVWRNLKLPPAPRIIAATNDLDVQFAGKWYGNDNEPDYRLVLAWHLNDAGPDAPDAASEVAVALLVASASAMQHKPAGLKPQAWLLRRIVVECDEAEQALSLLLNAGQVPRERIRHFWHSCLKGMPQHATLGAVEQSGLDVTEHALDKAAGPQAPAARWLLPVLATTAVRYGQGAQLLALPHGSGIAFNLVAKEPAPVDVPWKEEYEYSLFPAESIVALLMLFLFAVVVVLLEGPWNLFLTVLACLLGAASALLIAGERLAHNWTVERFWRQFQ